MSYLLQMVRRRSQAPHAPVPRVDEYARLNRPGLYGDYLFCATRLEHNKRPGLMLEALAASRSRTRRA